MVILTSALLLWTPCRKQDMTRTGQHWANTKGFLESFPVNSSYFGVKILHKLQKCWRQLKKNTSFLQIWPIWNFDLISILNNLKSLSHRFVVYFRDWNICNFLGTLGSPPYRSHPTSSGILPYFFSKLKWFLFLV